MPPYARAHPVLFRPLSAPSFLPLPSLPLQDTWSVVGSLNGRLVLRRSRRTMVRTTTTTSLITTFTLSKSALGRRGFSWRGTVDAARCSSTPRQGAAYLLESSLEALSPHHHHPRSPLRLAPRHHQPHQPRSLLRLAPHPPLHLRLRCHL